MTITERALLEHVGVQTPDYDLMGFVLDVSQLGVDDLGDGSSDMHWQSWECDVTEIDVLRGGDRSGLEVSHEVGTATIVLKNAGDPLSVESPLRPNMLLRVTVTPDLYEPTERPVFTGQIADLATSVVFNPSSGKRDIYVVATIADAIKIHNETTRYGALPLLGYETLEERLTRLAGTSRTAINPPSADDPVTRYSFPAAAGLDGWVGTGGGAIVALQPSGIRRYSAPGVPNLLYRETNGLGLQFAVYASRIERTITGLVPGRAYRLRARMHQTGKPGTYVSSYRIGIDGTLFGDPTSPGFFGVSQEIPFLEFVASSSSHVLSISNADAYTPTPGATAERIGFYGITVEELQTDIPYRLRSTLLEASLSDHFDLATISTGAQWYVDGDGVTQFILPGSELPLIATFTDEPGHDESELEYGNVNGGYDTRELVNVITGVNLGIQDDPDNPGDTIALEDPIAVRNASSASQWGPRPVEVALNLYTGAPTYTTALEDRLEDMLIDHANPTILIRSIEWNAQENLEVLAALELGSRIAVKFNGTEQDSVIVGIGHKVSPRRWMTTLKLTPRETL